MRYFSWRDVLQKISDITRLVDVDAEAGRLERIILQKAMDHFPPSAMLQKTEKVKVENGIAQAPCNSTRVLRVTDTHGGKIGYRQTGVYIYPSRPHKELIVYYYTLPTVSIDGEETPVILYDMIDYLAYEAARMVLLDGLQTGTTNPNFYQVLVMESEKAYYKMKNSLRTISLDYQENMLQLNQTIMFYQNRGR